MRAEQNFAMAWQNLKQRKLRTSLTTLGVVIGITAIIALASLGEGFRIAVKQRMEQGFELNVLTIIPGNFLTGLRQPFSDEEIANVSRVSNVITATPVFQIGTVTLYNNQNDKETAALVATGVNFTQFWQLFPNRLVPENGSLPQKSQNDTIVIGYKVNHQNETQMPFANPNDNITMTISLPGYPPGKVTENFTVATTLQKRGTSGLANFDYWVFIPIEKAREIYNMKGAHLIFVQVADPDSSEQVADNIEALFPPFQISILVPITFIRQVDQVLNLIQVFLTAIASISLLVAGIGIMNIMTVSVMERTREIGIMKAIGARNATILIIFLSEAALIGLIGGLIGVPTAYGLSNFLSFALTSYMQRQASGDSFFNSSQNGQIGFSPVFSLEWTVAAIIFAIAICILFGLYPARKAAKLDPVKALRYE